jgi:hypothetical protein
LRPYTATTSSVPNGTIGVKRSKRLVTSVLYNRGRTRVSEDCIDPDAMHEGDLIAYVDGIARKAVAEHIHRCPACAQEMGELGILRPALAVKLYRHSCAEPDRLLACGLGELKDDESLAIT